MKKLLICGLAASLAFGFSGCGDDDAVGSHQQNPGQDIAWGNNPDPMPEGGWTAALLPMMAAFSSRSSSE